jgi:hypothetical protein
MRNADFELRIGEAQARAGRGGAPALAAASAFFFGDGIDFLKTVHRLGETSQFTALLHIMASPIQP